MPLVDITNPDIIKFLVENYEKTALLRIKWNTVNQAMLNQAATLNREEKGYRDTDALVSTIDAGMASLKAGMESGARNRRLKHIIDATHIPCVANMRKGHSLIDVGLGDPEDDPRLSRPDTDLTNDPVMRPIDPKQKQILYKGQPNFGRRMYLANRYKTASPEDRYYLAETMGWVYGWRLKDSYFSKHSPEHGRVWCLSREASRTGPQPDPPHYRDAGVEGKRCATG